MKFNKLAASTITSIVLLGSVGQLAVNVQPAEALKARQSITVTDRKSTRLNSSHVKRSRMPSSA